MPGLAVLHLLYLFYVVDVVDGQEWSRNVPTAPPIVEPVTHDRAARIDREIENKCFEGGKLVDCDSLQPLNITSFEEEAAMHLLTTACKRDVGVICTELKTALELLPCLEEKTHRPRCKNAIISFGKRMEHERMAAAISEKYDHAIIKVQHVTTIKESKPEFGDDVELPNIERQKREEENANLLTPSEAQELENSKHVAVYALGEQELIRKSKIYYLRIQRCMSNSVLAWAKLNGLVLPSSPGAVLNSKGNTWLPIGDWSERRLLEWGRRLNIDFFANEFSPIKSLPKPGVFVYIIAMRNPLDRVFSHFKAAKRKFEDTPLRGRAEAYPWKSFADWVMDMKNGHRSESAEHKHLGSPYGFSNFHTHMLTGCATNCTREHLILAKTRLNYFSVILIQDQLELSTAALNKVLGWPLETMPLTEKEARILAQTDSKKELKSSPEALEILTEANNLDLELYEYALSLLKKLVEPVS